MITTAKKYNALVLARAAMEGTEGGFSEQEKKDAKNTIDEILTEMRQELEEV